MNTNLKMILSAVGVAALIASPAMAKSRHQQTAPSLVNVPADARASTDTYVAPRTVEQPYSADARVAPHQNSDLSNDFQLNGRF
jgi:hypothetical protein